MAVTPVKAIRLKCLDCCNGSSTEVKLCTVEKCPLYPFRDGHNPNRKGKGGNSSALLRYMESKNDKCIEENSPEENQRVE